MNEIIGRKEEIEKFDKIFTKDRSSFVAVYGRRRVGKTYLIREYFQRKFTFYFSGVSNGKLQRQLSNFHSALEKYTEQNTIMPKDWFEAFDQLENYINKIYTTEKKVIFIDEMPWLDTPRSEFVSALERFWNQWASARRDIILIACGSATAWIIKKIINSTGGLHNRVTDRIHLKQFTLNETRQFLSYHHFDWTTYQIIQSYMTFGGVPFYLEKLDPALSVDQNIDKLIFSEDGDLKNEYNNLVNSLFKKSSNYKKIIHVLCQKQMSQTRNEIADFTKIANGGGLTEKLEELKLCDIISEHTNLEQNISQKQYTISDHFLLFYHRFLYEKPFVKKDYWLNMLQQGEYFQWAGIAYEKLVYNHLKQVLKKLGIEGIQSISTCWRDQNRKPTAQIDLLIDRMDHVINLCEIKFTQAGITIDKSLAENLRNKREVFKYKSQTKKAVYLTLITTYPMKANSYSQELIRNNVSMEDLLVA